eukprot:gene8687-6108_t
MSSIREDETPLPEAGEWTISTLSKKLRRLEMEAKTLRRDVQNLEKTQNAVAVTEDTEHRLAERDPSLGTLPIPIEMVSLLADRAGELFIAGNEHKALYEELDKLQTAAERAAAKAQEAEQEYVSLAELVGGEGDDGVAPAAVVGLRTRDAYLYKLRGLSELYVQRELLRNQLDAQTIELARLIEEEEGTSRTAEQKAEAEAALLEKRVALLEHKSEQKLLQSSVRRADFMLQRKSLSAPLEERIRRAVVDGQVASAALDKTVERTKTSEMAIRARATRILMAERRLEMIAETISGGLENDERVDVDTFNSVMKEIEALRVLRLEGDYQTVTLDQDIEDISYKTNSIHHITLSTRAEREKVERVHERYMGLVQRDLEQKQAAHEEHIKALKDEVAAIRRSRRQQEASATTNGPRRSASASASKTNNNASRRTWTLFSLRFRDGSWRGVGPGAFLPLWRMRRENPPRAPRTFFRDNHRHSDWGGCGPHSPYNNESRSPRLLDSTIAWSTGAQPAKTTGSVAFLVIELSCSRAGAGRPGHVAGAVEDKKKGVSSWMHTTAVVFCVSDVPLSIRSEQQQKRNMYLYTVLCICFPALFHITVQSTFLLLNTESPTSAALSFLCLTAPIPHPPPPLLWQRVRETFSHPYHLPRRRPFRYLLRCWLWGHRRTRVSASPMTWEVDSSAHNVARSSFAHKKREENNNNTAFPVLHPRRRTNEMRSINRLSLSLSFLCVCVLAFTFLAVVLVCVNPLFRSPAQLPAAELISPSDSRGAATARGDITLPSFSFAQKKHPHDF